VAEVHQADVVANMGVGQEDGVQSRRPKPGGRQLIEQLKLLSKIRRGVEEVATLTVDHGD